MNSPLLNIIPVIFAFSWIFPDHKYGCCFNQLHSGHVCLFLNMSWQQIWTMLYWTPFRSFWRSPEYFLTTNYGCCLNPPHSGIFCFLLNVFDKKYGRCFTELYSGHFCGLNISHWHCLNQVHFCIFLNISWEKYSPFKSRTIVESIKTKRKT